MISCNQVSLWWCGWLAASAMGNPGDVAAYAGWKSEKLATASVAVGGKNVFWRMLTSEWLRVAVQDRQCVLSIVKVPHMFFFPSDEPYSNPYSIRVFGKSKSYLLLPSFAVGRLIARHLGGKCQTSEGSGTRYSAAGAEWFTKPLTELFWRWFPPPGRKLKVDRAIAASMFQDYNTAVNNEWVGAGGNLLPL